MAEGLGTTTLETAVDLSGLAKGLAAAEDEAGQSGGRMGNALKGALNVAGGAAAGAAVAGAVALGAALFDASEQASAITTALGDLGTGEIQAVADGAGLLKARYGVELPEVLTGVRSLMDNFGLSSKDALDFVTAGFEKGMDKSGDFIDSIGEYGTQFAEGGASAAQFFSLMETGSQAGVLGTDKAADAFKEFRLRIQDGSDGTAMALSQLGLNTDQVLAGLSDGSLQVADVFGMVTEALAATEDPTLRMQAGAALIGSQFEDLGDSAVTALSMSSTSADDLAGSTEEAAGRVGSLGEVLPRLMQDLSTAMIPVVEQLIPIIQEHMPTFQKVLGLLVEVGVPLFIGAIDLLNLALTGLSAIMDGDLSAAFRGLQLIFAPVMLALMGFREWLWGFGEWWRELFHQMVQGAIDRVTALVDWFVSLPRRMYDAGKNFIMGLVEGVQHAWSSFWEETRRKVFGWIDDFNGWLGNHSPSAKARGAARNFFGGFALGAGDMEGAVGEASMGVAGAALAPLMSMDASRTTTNTVNMTVNSQAPTSTVISDLNLARAAIGA